MPSSTDATRVLVIGPGGAGKSTFARALGAKLGLPVIHLDALYWQPGWRATEPEEWERLVTGAAEQPEWIMDGNYGGTFDVRMPRADMIVFLDTPAWLCTVRVLRRWWRFRGRSRPSMPVGCPERVTPEFLHWIWSYGRRRRPDVLERLRSMDDQKRVVVLRPTDVRHFLDQLTPPTKEPVP